MSRNWICRGFGHSRGIRGDLELIEIDAIGVRYWSAPERASRKAIALTGRWFVGMALVGRRICRVRETIVYRSIGGMLKRRSPGMGYERQLCSMRVVRV